MTKGKHSKGKHDKKAVEKADHEQNYSYVPLDDSDALPKDDIGDFEASPNNSDETRALDASEEPRQYFDESPRQSYGETLPQAYGTTSKHPYDAAPQQAYGDTSQQPPWDTEPEQAYNAAPQQPYGTAQQQAYFIPQDDIEYDDEGHSKRHFNFKILRRVLIIVGVVLLAIYIGGAVFFMSHFEPNTKISDVDCSYKDISSTESAVSDHISDYKLTITERTSGTDNTATTTESIKGSSIGVEYVSDGTVSKLLKSQNVFAWPAKLFSRSLSNNQVNVKYDDTKLKSAISSLKCMDTASMVAPADATIAFNGTEYVVQTEVIGTTLDASSTQTAIATAVSDTDANINLSDTGCYKNPNVYSDSPELQSKLTLYNKYVPFSITYQFSDGTEVLDGNTAINWYNIDSNGNATLRDDAVSDWVADMASRHDTVDTTRTFTSKDGKQATVSGGTYGWQIDQDAEVADIKTALTSHKSVTREPDWAQTAASNAANDDWGNTYIEISISDQHWWYVKDGSVALETDCVTGLPTADKATPTGVYDILEMQSPYTMHGTQYSDGSYAYVTDCSYWMRVTWTGVGIHDAPWKSVFGGTEYQTSGSHGCINTPSDIAGELYGMLEVGTPVVIHD